MDLFLLLLAFLGHAALWVGLVNRIHATAVPHWPGHLLSLLCLMGLVLVPLGFAWSLAPAGFAVLLEFSWRDLDPAALAYIAVCWLVAGVAISRWMRRVPLHRPPAILRFHRTRSVVPAQDAGGTNLEEHAHHYLVRLPGNQMLQLDLTERGIDVPGLAPALDGLSIVHFSDLHFTGRVAKAYFQEVVRISNQTDPDLVAITGDLVDRSRCIDWIPDTLGKLRSRHGVYFVFGNHDIRVDSRRLRRVLRECGLVDLGGRWTEVRIRGEPVVLAGNELPWLRPAADLGNCPPRVRGPLRIILSHSPDQLAWAQAHQADLMLAGHTHGGQIRLPLIGPILAPSRSGVQYASGVFHAPPTILQVTRGVSGEFPLRLNCPPEMAHLVLHSPARHAGP